jgi:hypothetical protein
MVRRRVKTKKPLVDAKNGCIASKAELMPMQQLKTSTK